MTQPVVRVAVGVLIRNTDCLITKRAADAHQGGLWEFPGGKLEAAESVAQALQRELREELGVLVRGSVPLLCVKHAYADKAVQLHAHLIEEFDGVPVGRERQPLRWVAISKLSRFEFPSANRAIIEALQQRFAGEAERVQDDDSDPNRCVPTPR